MKIIETLPLEKCLAKTCQKNGMNQKGCNVRTHLRACARVVEVLKKVYAGYPREKFLGNETKFLAALHDIGKVSPVFQQKIYDALGLKNELPFDVGPGNNDIQGHDIISGCTIHKVFYNLDTTDKLHQIISAHHGHGVRLGKNRAVSEIYGGENWEKLREELLESMREEFQLNEIPKIEKNEEAVFLGALIVSDWLSSALELTEDDVLEERMISEVVESSGFMPFEVVNNLSFQDVFGFAPNALQETLNAHVTPGGVYIVESEMGSGKTEAALYLAYQLLEKKQANGIYFALPTQLTSEKIHDRMNQFLQKILVDKQKTSKENLLIHGNAWMEWILKTTTDEDVTTSTDVNSWFEKRKRALLAPFGVGTIDQSLLAVLNVDHNAVRAFALSGKVVIIDEVHSYDAYTGSLVQSLVEKLTHWGATVIILSATLTQEARSALLEIDAKVLESHAYPLVSIRQNSGEIVEIPFAGTESRSIHLAHTGNKDVAFQKSIEIARNGGEVLWIENTVHNAQDTFCKFKAILPDTIECGLIHSRYPKSRRDEHESYWVELYGKVGGMNQKRLEKGRILVGTQVLEQSLDIDSDFLVTALAPSDMLLQRIGRLWRHRTLNTTRKVSECTAMIVYPDFTDKSFSSLALPYDPYTLLRTYDVWSPRTSILLPDDIREILEGTYVVQKETGARAGYLRELNNKKALLKSAAHYAQSSLGSPKNDDESVLSTRYSEFDSVDVLLIPIEHQSDWNQGRIFTVANPEKCIALPTDKPKNPKDAVRITSMLMQAMVRVPRKDAPAYNDFPLEALKDYLWIGMEEKRPIRAAFVDHSGALLTQSMLPISDTNTYVYKDSIGYCKEMKGASSN